MRRAVWACAGGAQRAGLGSVVSAQALLPQPVRDLVPEIWCAAGAECEGCGRQWVSVHQADADIVCPRCGSKDVWRKMTEGDDGMGCKKKGRGGGKRGR